MLFSYGEKKGELLGIGLGALLFLHVSRAFDDTLGYWVRRVLNSEKSCIFYE